jgi:hypothetical protein
MMEVFIVRLELLCHDKSLKLQFIEKLVYSFCMCKLALCFRNWWSKLSTTRSYEFGHFKCSS